MIGTLTPFLTWQGVLAVAADESQPDRTCGYSQPDFLNLR
jgi:hypothetical protein